MYGARAAMHRVWMVVAGSALIATAAAAGLVLLVTTG